jgi:hypothetical protein
MARGRGRLPAIAQLPPEATPIITWAADQLRKLDDGARTQTDIYQEFYAKLEALQREHRGELEFSIPSFSAFNRYSIGVVAEARRLDETREITSTLAKSFDAKASDDLTVIAAEAIKTLVYELIRATGRAGWSPKETLELSGALFKASQAQGVSTARRQKVEKEFKAEVSEAVDTVAKIKGMSSETAEQIKAQILGVRAKA